MSIAEDTVKSAIVTFDDGISGWQSRVNSQIDSSYKVCDSRDAELVDFFLRPVEIYSFDWTINEAFPPFRIFPWTEYFLRNALVKERVRQYSLLRASHINIKILLNGNPFYMGRLIASYVPTGILDEFSISQYDNNILTGGTGGRLTKVTQRPHIFLNPSTSEGGTLRMPFFCRHNYVNLHGQSLDEMGCLEFDQLTSLKYTNTTGPVSPNALIPVKVYAWMEETELAVPTIYPLPTLQADIAYEVNILPTSNNHPIESPTVQAVAQAGDEYAEEGKVSKVATSVAESAGKLSSLPIIGPYARASQMVSSSVGKIASLFGWSRPVLLDVPKPYNPRPIGILANTNVDDGSVKLSTDVKQEVTVDPRTTGLGNMDELGISGIASRMAYMFSVDWDVSQNTTPVTLALIGVNPCMWNLETMIPRQQAPGNNQHGWTWDYNTAYGVAFLPCGFASAPFSNWRGSMVYRFQIVAPRFTRGRIRISYDPLGVSSTVSPELVDVNNQYTRIVDISDTTDFTLTIGWGSANPVLSVNPPKLPEGNTYYDPAVDDFPYKRNEAQRWYVKGGTEPGNIEPDSCYFKGKNVQKYGYNGMISISTVTNLHNPLQVGDITINVYGGCGSNIEFYNPTNYITKLSPLPQRWMQNVPPGSVEAVAQAGVEGPEPLAEGDYGSPLGGTATVLAPMLNSTDPSDNTDMIMFGEAISTFRSLMKRFVYYTTVGFVNPYTSPPPQVIRGWHFCKVILSATPAHPGFTLGANSNGLYELVDSSRVDCNLVTMFSYLSTAFLGWRGGHRWKVHTMEYKEDNNSVSSTTIVRVPYNSTENPSYCRKGIYVGVVPDDDYGKMVDMSLIAPPINAGGHTTDTRVNPYLEVEIPYHNQERFTPARRISPDLNASKVEDIYVNSSNFCTMVSNYQGAFPPESLGNIQRLSYYHSCADDMNFFFFIGAPTLYVTLPIAYPPLRSDVNQFQVSTPYEHV